MKTGAGAAGLGGFITILENAADKVREKFKEIKIGTARSGFDVETFQRLNNLVKSVGLEFGSVSKGLDAIAVKMQEIRESGPGAEKTLVNFQRLGVSLKDITSKDRHEIFLQIAESLKTLPLTDERAAALKELFKSLPELLPALQKGLFSKTAGIGLLSEADLKDLERVHGQMQRIKAVTEEAETAMGTFWAKVKAGTYLGLQFLFDKETRRTLLGSAEASGADILRTRPTGKLDAELDKAARAQAALRAMVDAKIIEDERILGPIREARNRKDLEDLRNQNANDAAQGRLPAKLAVFRALDMKVEARIAEIKKQLDNLRANAPFGPREARLAEEELDLETELRRLQKGRQPPPLPTLDRQRGDSLVAVGNFLGTRGAGATDSQAQLRTIEMRLAQIEQHARRLVDQVDRVGGGF